MKKTIKVLAVIMAALIVLSACASPKNESPAAPNPYSMKDIFKESEVRIVDIAMLGSHDSFSNIITEKSELDPDNGSTYMGYGILGSLIKNISKAQSANAYEQLTYGVRYFDVRISYYNGEWWTKHNKLFAPLFDYVSDVIKYLTENPGEVIVFDMQHVYLGEKTVTEFFSALNNMRYNGTSLFDFVNYQTVGENAVALSELTYNSVTSGGENSAAVMLFKATPKDEDILNKFFDRDASIRSEWHDKNSEKEMFDGIDAEYAYLSEHFDEYADILRVNQAQMTAQVNLSVLTANLLKYADDFNSKQLERDSFKDYLKVMPIFMVDNATTNANDFNFEAIKIIKEFNGELANG